MLFVETGFMYRYKLRMNGSKPALEKMRLLQHIAYYTNWAPLFLELHRFDSYLTSQQIGGVKTEYDMQESPKARAFCFARDGFIAFLALLATVSAGAVKDRDLTVYAILFDVALGAAYVANTFIFTQRKPESKDGQEDDAS